MREVKAFIRANMTGNVVRALKHEGYRHVTILDVSALHEPLWGEAQGASPELGVFSRMVKIEILCKDEDVQTLIKVIRSAAHTGSPGDGIISVSEVANCHAIRTGESGVEAL